MFLELYWQYFAIGIFSYIVARFGYIFFKQSQKNTVTKEKLNEDFRTPDEGKFHLFMLFFKSKISKI